MVIKIEVDQAIKTGAERKAMETVKQLNRKGLKHAANAIWKGKLLQVDFCEEKPNDSCREDLMSLLELGDLTDTAASVEFHLVVEMAQVQDT